MNSAPQRFFLTYVRHHQQAGGQGGHMVLQLPDQGGQMMGHPQMQMPIQPHGNTTRQSPVVLVGPDQMVVNRTMRTGTSSEIQSQQHQEHKKQLKRAANRKSAQLSRLRKKQAVEELTRENKDLKVGSSCPLLLFVSMCVCVQHNAKPSSGGLSLITGAHHERFVYCRY